MIGRPLGAVTRPSGSDACDNATLAGGPTIQALCLFRERCIDLGVLTAKVVTGEPAGHEEDLRVGGAV